MIFKIFLLFIFFFFPFFKIVEAGQNRSFDVDFMPVDSNIIKSNPSVEEVPIQINAEKIGTIELNSFINGKIIYVPIGELFNYIKVNNNLTDYNSIIKGFFVNENINYIIDVNENKAELNGKKVEVNRKDFFIDEADLFMNSVLFDKIFGIHMDFDIKQLRIYLTSATKLPIVIEQEREAMRENLGTTMPKTKADIFIPRKRKMLGLGVLDWLFSAGHSSPVNDVYSYNVSLGSEIFGGDFISNINGSKEDFANFENASWKWRYVDEKKWFKQALVGDIVPTSGLLFNTRGFQLTNSPPISRTTIGTYKIFDQTNPNWDVELYVNNELAGYTRANNTGYFEFKIPLLYGSNFITLKFYGPSGEVRSQEKVIQVPYVFLPKGTFEYNISGGTLKSGDHNEFSESAFTWGSTSFLTLGSNLIYLNAPGVRKFYPSGNFSLKILDNLIISSNIFANLKGTASLSILLPSQISSEISYTSYKENSFFNPLGYKDERNYTLFFPLSLSKFSTSFRFNVKELTGKDNKLLMLNSGFFFSYSKFQGSVATDGSWMKMNETYDAQNIKTIITLSYRLFNNTLLRQETDYEHTTGKVTNAGLFVDKGLFDTGWLSAYIFRDFNNKNYYGGLNFRYDFSFSRVSTDFSANDYSWNLQQTFYGSIGYDDFKKRFITDNQNFVSRGGISLVPFLDMNSNDILDENEKILKTEMNTKLDAGKLLKSNDNQNFWYSDLDPYNDYILEINPVSFDNPAYRPKYRNFAIRIDPNRFKTVPIPIFISGIISGRVSTKTEIGDKGVGRMKMILESLDGKQKMEKMTFSDGEYIFENVPPGKYKIYPAPAELSKKSMKTDLEEQIVELKSLEDGDMVNDINFILTVLK
jgi:hypothetical protein